VACQEGEHTVKKAMNATLTIAAKDHAYRRRWAISGAIVVLVHATVMVAVATWHIMIKDSRPPGPIMIELAPAGPQQAVLAPTPDQLMPDTSSGATKKIEETAEVSPSKVEERVEPKRVEEQPREALPMSSARAPSSQQTPAPSSQQKSVAGRQSAPGTGDKAINANPIDTSIIPSAPRSMKAAKASDGKVIIFGRLPRRFGVPQQSRALDSTARNAIGNYLQDRANADATRPDPARPQPNALGLINKHSVGTSATSGASDPARNAIGAIMIKQLSAATAQTSHQSSGLVAAAGRPVTNAAINGTGMARPGSLGGTIGGPAKNGTGVINGTGIRSKHP
jgi:hypothetical protein